MALSTLAWLVSPERYITILVLFFLKKKIRSECLLPFFHVHWFHAEYTACYIQRIFPPPCCSVEGSSLCPYHSPDMLVLTWSRPLLTHCFIGLLHLCFALPQKFQFYGISPVRNWNKDLNHHMWTLKWDRSRANVLILEWCMFTTILFNHYQSVCDSFFFFFIIHKTTFPASWPPTWHFVGIV